MEVQIVNAKSGKNIGQLELSPSTTILEVKHAFRQLKPALYPERQAFKTDPKGKTLKDTETLASLGFKTDARLYFKDLGPQIGWTTVFLTEYAGPLVVYLLFYPRPAIIYGAAAATAPRHYVVTWACAAWTFHYAKRLFETVFVHRFSNATMPIANIFKNSSYYWGFAAFVSYFVNHPQYTPACFGETQIYTGLGLYILGELGNLSAHLLLRNLRPPGTKERRIPYPNSNPLTTMFNFTSCANYTYEAISWIGFTIMAQSLPAGLFTLAGLYQMSVWALGKHRNYKREFKDYPRSRKAIVPFLL